MTLVPGFPEFTKDWLEEVLKKSESLPSAAKIVSAESEAVGATQGFLSKVTRVRLSWAGGKGPERVILKVPVASGMEGLSAEMSGGAGEATPAEAGKGAFDFVFLVHSTECAFYDFVRNFKAPLKTPRSYFCQRHEEGKTGVIVLEDVGAIGRVPHMSYPLNRSQLAAVFAEVAKFHAYSLSQPAFFGIQLQQEMKPEDMTSFITFVTGVCKSLKAQQPEMFGALVDQIMPYITTENFMGSFLHFIVSGTTPVLVHGDLWNNNFFFNATKDADGKDHHGDELVAIIDFQMCRSGLPGDDLAHVLLSSVENELWSGDLSGVISELYYEPLKKALPEGMPVPFTVEDVVGQIKDLCLPNVLQGLATGASQMPSLLQDSDPSAQARLGRLLNRMRTNLAWAIPHLKALTPPTPEQLAEAMKAMAIINSPK